MRTLKISNVIKDDSCDLDYKGLNIEKIIPSTQEYCYVDNLCILKTSESLEELPIDVEEITEDEYFQIKSLIHNNAQSTDPILEQIHLMQAALDELLLNGGI